MSQFWNRVFKKKPVTEMAAPELDPQVELQNKLCEFEKAFPHGGPVVVKALKKAHPDDWTSRFTRNVNDALEQVIHRKNVPLVEVEDEEDKLVSAQPRSAFPRANHTTDSSFSSSKLSSISFTGLERIRPGCHLSGSRPRCASCKALASTFRILNLRCHCTGCPGG